MTDLLLGTLEETAVWLEERAEVIRYLADRGRVANRQDLRDEAARHDGQAVLIRQVIEDSRRRQAQAVPGAA